MEEIINKVVEWVKTEKDVVALAIVGSYARGTAKEDSDIDIVIITNNPEAYLDSDKWIEQFGKIKELKKEDYGLMQSRRVFYVDGYEVEFGITIPEWAKTNPIDEGTKMVIADGVKILYDKSGLLNNLLTALNLGI
ncbi:MAG TPA: nucleotidyltransferase domain-containing protein [Candidatus Paceibacterota bacterium]